MKILTVNNLSKVYGKKIIFNALNDINFSIEYGEFVGIMGPSGSGKTTLLNMISTIDKPYRNYGAKGQESFIVKR